jgi:hypothetical protein
MSAKTIKYSSQEFVDLLGSAVATINDPDYGIKALFLGDSSTNEVSNIRALIQTMVNTGETPEKSSRLPLHSVQKNVFVKHRSHRYHELIAHVLFNNNTYMGVRADRLTGNRDVSFDGLCHRIKSQFGHRELSEDGMASYVRFGVNPRCSTQELFELVTPALAKIGFAFSWASTRINLNLLKEITGTPVVDYDAGTFDMRVGGNRRSFLFQEQQVDPLTNQLSGTSIVMLQNAFSQFRDGSGYRTSTSITNVIRHDNDYNRRVLELLLNESVYTLLDADRKSFPEFLQWHDVRDSYTDNTFITVFPGDSALDTLFTDAVLTYVGEFQEIDNHARTPEDLIRMTSLLRSYSASSASLAMPVAAVQNYIPLDRCALTNTLYNDALLKTFDGVKDTEIIPCKINRYQLIEQLGQYAVIECSECNSRTHNDTDEIIDLIYTHEASFIQLLQSKFDNVDRIVEDIADFLMSNVDEEEPEDGMYCYQCERGEYPEHNRRFYGISNDTIQNISTALEPLNKTVASESYRNETVYYIKDKERSTPIDIGSLADDYFLNDHDHTPALDFIISKQEKELLNSADAPKDEPLFLGLEWEIDQAGEASDRSFIINSALSKNKSRSWTMRDGSLSDGIEIATMPATLAAHMTEFDYEAACVVASKLGYQGHDTGTSGIHVHMSRKFFGKDQKIQLYKGAIMALVLERHWNDFVRFSRRRYNRIEQWANKKDMLVKMPVDANRDDVEKSFINCYGYDKYVALNTTKSATFELRIFKSTLKASTIKATLQLVHNLAHWAKNNDLAAAQAVSFQDIINYQSHKELTEYWQVAKDREIQS